MCPWSLDHKKEHWDSLQDRGQEWPLVQTRSKESTNKKNERYRFTASPSLALPSFQCFSSLSAPFLFLMVFCSLHSPVYLRLTPLAPRSLVNLGKFYRPESCRKLTESLFHNNFWCKLANAFQEHLNAPLSKWLLPAPPGGIRRMYGGAGIDHFIAPCWETLV